MTMSSKTHKNAGKGENKTFASKRTMNPPNENGAHQPNTGDQKGFQHQDPERQFGNFEERGKHSRTGDRNK